MDQQQNKRRALGRGLEDLFNIEDINYGKLEERIMETAKEEEIHEISLDEIRVNPYQPRKTFDENALNELAESIKIHGIIQPIIVKKSIKGYEIVAGERRYRASRLAGKTSIPAIIRDFSDEQMMEIAVLENLQRENLNAIEEAEAYKNLMTNLNLNHEELAKKVGKSRSHITNMLGILSLPTVVKNLISENKISMGHARVLSKLEDNAKINELAHNVVEQQLSVRELEEMTHDNTFIRKNKIIRKETNNEYSNVERELSDFLGTKVKLSNQKMTVFFANDQDLNRILDIIKFNK